MSVFAFWTDCGGAIVFLFRFMAAHHHVTTNSVSLLNKCTASVAQKSISSRIQKAFDAGYRNTDVSGVRHYGDRRDRLTQLKSRGSGTYFVVRTFDEKNEWGTKPLCDFWNLREIQVMCFFYHHRVAFTVRDHPLALRHPILGEEPADQNALDRFNQLLTLPDEPRSVFGSGVGHCVHVSDALYGIYVVDDVFDNVYTSVHIIFNHDCDEMPLVQQKRFMWQYAVACLCKIRANAMLEYETLSKLPR